MTPSPRRLGSACVLGPLWASTQHPAVPSPLNVPASHEPSRTFPDSLTSCLPPQPPASRTCWPSCLPGSCSVRGSAALSTRCRHGGRRGRPGKDGTAFPLLCPSAVPSPLLLRGELVVSNTAHPYQSSVNPWPTSLYNLGLRSPVSAPSPRPLTSCNFRHPRRASPWTTCVCGVVQTCLCQVLATRTHPFTSSHTVCAQSEPLWVSLKQILESVNYICLFL